MLKKLTSGKTGIVTYMVATAVFYVSCYGIGKLLGEKLGECIAEVLIQE